MHIWLEKWYGVHINGVLVYNPLRVIQQMLLGNIRNFYLYETRQHVMAITRRLRIEDVK